MLAISRTMLARPRFWVGVHLLFTVVLGLQIPRLKLRTDGAAIHPTGNAVVEQTAVDRETFAEDRQLILLVTSRPAGPEITSPGGLAFLNRLHRELDTFPGVRRYGVRSVASLLEAPVDRTLSARPYLREVPESPAELRTLLERLYDHPLTDGLFLSREGRAAAFYVPVASGTDPESLLARLSPWLEEGETAGFDLSLSGPVVAETLLGESVLRDLARLVPVMVVVMALALFASLGTVAGVLIPLLEVLVVLVWTLGAMASFGVPVTLMTTILPVVLMAMAVIDEIYLLERLQARRAEAGGSDGSGPGSGDRSLRPAVLGALADVGRPIVLTSLTTAVAFLSFLSAPLAPMRHFGLFAALGILLAMVSSFTLIPTLATLLPPAWWRPLRRRRPGRLLAYERAAVRHRRAGFRTGVAVLALSVPGLFLLSVQDAWVDNFDPGSRLVTAEREFNRVFWGSYRLDVVCRSPEPAFFHQPRGVSLMEELTELAREGPHVGGVVSYLIPFELVARAWGHDGALSALSPTELKRTHARLGPVKHRIDLEQLVTLNARSARLRILVRSPDYRKGEALRRHLEEGIRALLGEASSTTGLPVACHLSGDLPVALEVVRSIVVNQVRSFGWTVLSVGVLAALALRDARRVFVVLLPVVAGATLVLASMGYGGLPLGIATSMFTALTIGVGVDFALHLTHAYGRHRTATPEEALNGALATTGRALRWNTLVLSAGFLVLTFSALRPNHSLGLLLAAATVSCYGVTLLLLPWLLERTSTREIRPPAPLSQGERGRG